MSRMIPRATSTLRHDRLGTVPFVWAGDFDDEQKFIQPYDDEIGVQEVRTRHKQAELPRD